MPMAPTLRRAAIGVRILETVANYGRAELKESPPRRQDGALYFVADDDFWYQALRGGPLGMDVEIPIEVVVSEWVARVPGLFWTNGSQALRREGERNVESSSGNHITLKPLGKSNLVSGGVGTMKLPPSEAGYRLVTLTASANVSAGVPALIAPEVWDHHRLREGSVIKVQRPTWQAMAKAWASEFPSTRDIPRAYVRIDNPAAVRVVQQGAAAEIHPFSIMQYFDGRAELFDFVFATGYSTDPGMRHGISQFFDHYRRAEGRDGQYLIDADVGQPMWESRYHSPEEVRQAEDLLQRRIADAMLGNNVTEVLLGVLSGLSEGELRKVSTEIGIPPATWFRGGAAVQQAQDLMAAVPPEKIPALIDAIRTLQPDLIPK